MATSVRSEEGLQIGRKARYTATSTTTLRVSGFDARLVYVDASLQALRSAAATSASRRPSQRPAWQSHGIRCTLPDYELCKAISSVRLRLVETHEQLIQLIEAGDGEGAETLWREYWDWITPFTHPEKAIVDVLRNLEDDGG